MTELSALRGRLSAATRDFAGETLGSFSGMALDLASWRRNANGSYSGTMFTLPDRGPNDVGPFVGTTNYRNRVHISAITLTRDAWVSPGQWGQDLWVMLLVACLGGMVVHQVGRWETTGAFLAVYAGLEFARNAWLGWTLDVFLQRLSSGSLILFAFFMITDPRAIPDHRLCRAGWAAAVAGLTFVLRNYFFLPTALFWSLFALSPVTILLDRVWPAERFRWIPEGNREPLLQTVSLEVKPCA